MTKSKKELSDEVTDLKVKIIFMASEIAKLNRIITQLKNPYI